MALSRSSSGYFLGAAMLLILPWIQSLHQTRGDSSATITHYCNGGSPLQAVPTVAVMVGGGVYGRSAARRVMEACEAFTARRVPRMRIVDL